MGCCLVVLFVVIEKKSIKLPFSHSCRFFVNFPTFLHCANNNYLYSVSSVQGCVFTCDPECTHPVSWVTFITQRQWRFGPVAQQLPAVLHQFTALGQSPPPHPGTPPHRQQQPGPQSLWQVNRAMSRAIKVTEGCTLIGHLSLGSCLNSIYCCNRNPAAEYNLL